jgi:K+-sensing histidine kinase KdpD
MSNLEHLEKEISKSQETLARIWEAPSSDFERQIRVPLVTLVNMAKMLKDRSKEDSMDFVYKTVADILEYARMEAGGVKLETSEFKIENILKRPLETFERLALENGLKPETKIQYKKGTKLLGDAKQAEQMLSRLVRYVLGHVSKGSVSVSVSTAKSFGECLNYSSGTSLHFSLKSPKLKLFVIPNEGASSCEPLLFDESSKISQKAGFQNGLDVDISVYISKIIAETMGGRLWIEDDEKHTVFNVVLPFKFA